MIMSVGHHLQITYICSYTRKPAFSLLFVCGRLYTNINRRLISSGMNEECKKEANSQYSQVQDKTKRYKEVCAGREILSSIQAAD